MHIPLIPSLPLRLLRIIIILLLRLLQEVCKAARHSLLSWRDLKDRHWDVCIQAWPPSSHRFQNNDRFEIIHKLQNCDRYYEILIFKCLSS